MAKQDAIIDRPHQTEKESATNGFCKDKQLQLQLKPQQDAVDVASLAIGETPPSGRQDNSARLSHRPSPQQQQRQHRQQPQPLHRRPSPGSPPTQSLSVLQEQHPLKNTTANGPTTSSPAGLERGGEGGAMVNKPLDGPSPSNFTTHAVDLDPTSVQTLDNSEDTKGNDGLARWHSWVNQQAKNGIVGNASDLTSWRDGTLEITPTSLIQYLEAVVLPLERASSLSTADTSTSASTATFSVTSRKGATSVIETYLKPVLQLWQHQHQHKEGQLRQEQEQQQQPRRYPDPTSSSSSVTLSSESKSFHESLSDDRAVVLSVQQAIRQQDQIQRLIHLEKSHQDTALVISQLQDRVQRLVDDCAHQKRLQLHSHQAKDQNMLRACDNESGSNGIVGLATLIERHSVHRGYSPSTRRHHQGQQCQQQQTNGYYGGRGETHRADELIEVIAKGLEEYHARAAYERARQRSGTDPSTTGHDHSSWRHIDLTGDNASGPLHPPQSPHDSAVDYHHHYEVETSDRSLGPHQRQSTSYYEDQSPTQLHHNHHHVNIYKQQQRLQIQQIHGEIQHDDLLEVPLHHPPHDRPVRSRKRSSSMSGPGGVHRENIKHARSCSPSHPRIISDTPRTGAEETDAAAMTSAISNSHAHTQTSTEPLEKSEQEPKLDGHHKSPKSGINLESSASTSAAASLALLHYGSVERARQHSVSPQDVDLHTRQQSAHPSTVSKQHLQAKGDKALDHYPSHSPQDHGFNYTSTQVRRIDPPPYGEGDYRSYPEHSQQPVRHHSHPSQSYSHLEDMTAQSMTELTGYRSLELGTRVSPYSHTTGTTTAYTVPKLPVFRGKHTKNQESFGYTSCSEPAQQRRQSHPSPSQPTSVLTPASKPHPYQCDESTIYSGYEQPQQQPQQHQQQHQQPHLSRHQGSVDDEDLKSPQLQLREFQHQHLQHHQYLPQSQQQQQQQHQQQQRLHYHHQQLQHSVHHHHHQQHHHQQQQQQQHRNHHQLHHHDPHHQHSLQSSSTSSPPPTSSNQHQHQHQYHPLPPIYVMNRQVNTVPELWKEWTVGLGPGHPSIRQLEAQYGPSWRTSSSAANFFSRRLRIIHEIQRMVDYEGLTEEEAVNRLEARREQGVVVPGSEGHTALASSSDTAGGGAGMSLHRLSEILRKKQL